MDVLGSVLFSNPHRRQPSKLLDSLLAINQADIRSKLTSVPVIIIPFSDRLVSLMTYPLVDAHRSTS